MEIINETGLPVAPLPGRINFPGHSLTLIVKGTYRLRANDRVEPAEEQRFPTGDEYYPDDADGLGAPRYASDFAYLKPQSDLLLVGSCHTPDHRPMTACPVRFQVGNLSRTLLVTGNRHVRSFLPARGASPPAAFTSLSIRYENCYGGVDHPDNPIGKGRSRILLDDGKKRKPLPNIAEASQPASLFQHSRTPAGFGPIKGSWPLRKGKLGSYKGGYVKERWPWFAADMDWTYFNAAPPEMQMPGYLAGDELLTLDNLHPRHPRFTTRLPGIRLRCFLNMQADENQKSEFIEVRMNLDTLWIDADNEIMVLVWRGWTPVLSEEFDEVRQLYLATEKLADSQSDRAYWHDRFIRRLNEEEIAEAEPEADDLEPDSADDLDVAQELESAQAREREQFIAAGLDPDHLPPQSPEDRQFEAEVLEAYGISIHEDEDTQLTREMVIDMQAAGESFAAKDLTGLDLSGLDFGGADFEAAILMDTTLDKARLAGANLTHANLNKASLKAVLLTGADLSDADFSGSDLSRADLSTTTLNNTVFDNASMVAARLDHARGVDTLFTRTDLSNASLLACNLEGADFSNSCMAAANFKDAVLFQASFSGVSGPGIIMPGAKIDEARMIDGADFSHGNFQHAGGDESIWENAVLGGADFRYSRIKGADFTGADLQMANISFTDWSRSNLSKTNLDNATCVSMNLFLGSLEDASLKNANFRGSNLYGVEFYRVNTEGAHFEGANLKMTKLEARV